MRKGILNWLALLPLCISCKQSPEKDVMIASMQHSLEKSSRTIEAMSQTTMAALQEKRMAPGTSFKAEIWLPKAKQADRYKTKLIREIDRIGSACDANRGNCREADLISLKRWLKEYQDSSLSIDPLIHAEFARNFTDSADHGQSLTAIWTRLNDTDHFGQKERTALFAQLKLSVTQKANDIIRYCSEQVPNTGFYFTVYSAIVAQNSSVLYTGEPLEITAGIGVFSRKAQPKALINGKPCDLREDATFKYLITPAGKPGSYTIPVVLDFFDEDGKPLKISKNITYRLLPAAKDN